MPEDDFSDAALVLLGHGSTLNTESAAPVYQHAAELRRRGIFSEVREAFWKQQPDVKQVLAGVTLPRVFIAPLFMSEGYFGSRIIPRELGFSGDCTLRTPLSTLFYCKPVGTRDSMIRVLLARAREVVERHPFPRVPATRDTTLIVAGHGTQRNENSRVAVERQVELLRAVDTYADAQAVFMEEEPRIGECYRLARTRNLVVVPFFISDGLHTQEDLPVLLGEARSVVRQRLAAGQATWRNPTEKNGKLVWYASAVGTAPEIAEVILDRVREAGGG